MKTFLFFLFCALLINISYAQPPVSVNQQSLSTKVDSFAIVAAAKLNIDTNATAQELGQRIDEAISIIPGKHAGPLKWLHFLVFLFGTLVIGYFVSKHTIKQVSKLFAIMLLFITMGIVLSGCNKNFVQTTATYVEKHCPHTVFTDPTTGQLSVYYECDSIWATGAIQSKCQSLDLCIDAANGKIYGHIACSDTSIMNQLKSVKLK